MENILVYFLFLSIINISIQVVPLWNFQSSAFDLLSGNNNLTYTKYSSDLYGVNVQLNRTIYKENEEIKIKNKLYLEGEYYGETTFDDIESHYKIENGHYIICPKGKHHINIYYKGNRNPQEKIPDDFPNPNPDNWDLMCYYQNHNNFLFVAYLGKQVNFYQYAINNYYFITGKNIHEGIHAFKWTTEGKTQSDGSDKIMFAIIKEGGKYLLDYITVYVENNKEFYYQENNHRDLTTLKKNYLACFQRDTYNFYWFNYNNASDLEVGSHSENQEITEDNLNNLNIQIFTRTPLEFFENVEIEELKFIFAMYFAYYELKNDKGENYYGIIDVPNNKVIFNTKEEILTFIPYLDYAMLAITKNSAYKICVYRDENDCVYCGNNNFMLDSSNYNTCGTQCKTKYILKPNNICTDTCDDSIFIVKNDNECGLCKDLYSEKIYKMYNQPICLETKPDNSIYINEELKIIDCDKNYKFENGECITIKCHDNCDKCTMYSDDNNDQKCLSCKNDKMVLQDGNCVKACSDHYFLNVKKCEKCDDSCKSCNIFSINCTSCYNGQYLDKELETHFCRDCSDNCETCEFSEDNCITCNQTSLFRYFFNNSCYEKCPNNTKLNSKKNKCEIINNDNDKEKSKTDSILLSIFTIITGGLLFIILFCFFRRYCCQKKKYSDNLIHEINTELIE